MNVGPKGIALVKEFEGCKLTAYLDVVGILTIGVGHTGGVKIGDEITEAEADAFLQEDLRTAEDALKSVTTPLNQEQYDALCSLIFNIGVGAFKKSTLLKQLNAGDTQSAADQFLRWNRAGKNVIAGLTRRRVAERQLFLE